MIKKGIHRLRIAIILAFSTKEGLMKRRVAKIMSILNIINTSRLGVQVIMTSQAKCILLDKADFSIIAVLELGPSGEDAAVLYNKLLVSYQLGLKVMDILRDNFSAVHTLEEYLCLDTNTMTVLAGQEALDYSKLDNKKIDNIDLLN
jgi:hypothetical protein